MVLMPRVKAAGIGKMGWMGISSPDPWRDRAYGAMPGY
jgi:hypothetical protein